MISKYIYVLIIFGLLVNVGFVSAVGTGGLGLAISPKISSIPLGNQQTYSIKIVSTENFDDTLRVYITTDGISSSNKADLSWFGWTGNTVNIPAKGTVQIQNTIKIPVGISTGNKGFKIVVKSAKGISATDSGLFIITPQPTGGLGIAISPKISSIPLGSQQTYAIKVTSTENFDDIVRVYLTNDGIPSSNQLDLSLFDWKDKTITVPAGGTIQLQNKLTVPVGVNIGERTVNIVAKSSTGKSVNDSGLVTINPQTMHIVQSPEANPSNILVGEPTTVTITAKINPVPELLPSSIILERLDDNNNVIANLGQLYDDKTHGDILPGDSIFTTQTSFNEPNDGKVKLRVSVSYSSSPSPVLSNIFAVDAITLPSQQETETALSTNIEAENNFVSLKQTYGIEEARQMVVDSLKTDSNVDKVALNPEGNYINIVYSSGLEAAIPTGEEGTFGMPDSNLGVVMTSLWSDPNPFLNTRHNCNYVNSVLNAENCVKSTIFADSMFTLASINNLNDKGIIYIFTHGGKFGIFGDTVGLLTGEEVTTTLGIPNSHLTDWTLGRIESVPNNGRNYWAIKPSYITAHITSLPKSLVVINACESLFNDGMANAFLSKGASAYVGWTHSVDGAAQTITRTLFDRLAVHETLQQTFNGWTIADRTDSSANAVLEFRGDGSYELPRQRVTNGGFESQLSGWTSGFESDGYGTLGGYAITINGNVKAGSNALRLGRWDQIYTGGISGPPQPGTEPSGTDWIYQDADVPSTGNPRLTFSYNVQTYDTAIWDWFDMYIKDPNTGTNLATVVSRDGKPGYDYGTYWNGGWKDVSFDLTPWKGQKIRLWFGNRQDGYGDQMAVFIDNVLIPCS